MKQKNKKIDIKIGSREEAAWNAIKESAKRDIESMKKSIIINKAIIDLASNKEKEEHEKFKKESE